METERTLRAGAQKVARVLRGAGHQAFFAGGSVRDLLLGEQPKDYDVVTDARPERIAQLFRRTRMIGAAFGVVQVRIDRHAYEVATFRADGSYTDGRRPESVRYADTLEEDVARRDFTINALLMNPESDEVIDVVGGRADLEAGLVRAVGEPDRRFAEDRLRMLRAIRFAARFGFELESDTLAAVKRHAAEVWDVSVERIVIEVDGVLDSAFPERGLTLMDETGLASSALPFLPRGPEARSNVLARLVEHGAWRVLPEPERIHCAWAILLGELSPDEAERALRSMRASRERVRACRTLLERRETLRRAAPALDLLRMAADESVPTLQAYAEALGARDGYRALEDAVRSLRTDPLPPRPLLSGRELQAMGLSPGPAFKALLAGVDEQVLQRRIRTRAEAEAWVKERLS
ncbi:MAG: CCA tRNA nucleotidyltransferase [Myxococcota bacterium]